MFSFIDSIEYNCTKKYRTDCNYKYYVIEKKEIIEDKNGINQYISTSAITLIHNNLPNY